MDDGGVSLVSKWSFEYLSAEIGNAWSLVESLFCSVMDIAK